MRILIAEDDQISRRVLDGALKKRGYDVVVTCDGNEAWEVLRRNDRPQVAILDWMMPGMDGIEVCKKVREEIKGPYIYILILTAKGRKEEIAIGLDAGADDYITKPFNARELQARVQVGIRMVGLQNSLAEHVKKLEELDQLKSDFISIVSHELRTPVAVIQGGASLILDGVAGDVTESQTDLLTDIMENSDRLTRLITDLLDVSKIEAGKMIIRRRTVDICPLVEKIHNHFDLKAQEKGIQIKTELPNKELKLFVDADKVYQIFVNLISNALRFTESDGQIVIRVEEKEKVIECSVSDTGIGIAKNDIPKLFSKFVQIERVEASGYRGTGLGLVIVKGLVEKHGGKIWVESELGEGTTFRFTLKKQPFPSVLVVDDEKKIVDIVKRFLKVDNYRLLEAYDGAQALERATEAHPSLIVLDMMLPKKDGYEVINELKRNKKTQDIPILILSGVTVDKDRIVSMDNSHNIPVLGKPIKQEELLSNVQKMINSSA